MAPVSFDGTITIESLTSRRAVQITIAGEPITAVTVGDRNAPLRARPDNLFDCWVHWVSLPAAFAFAFLRALRP